MVCLSGFVIHPGTLVHVTMLRAAQPVRVAAHVHSSLFPASLSLLNMHFGSRKVTRAVSKLPRCHNVPLSSGWECQCQAVKEIQT